MTDRQVLEQLCRAARDYAYASSTRTERLFGEKLRSEIKKAEWYMSHTGSADMREAD